MAVSDKKKRVQISFDLDNLMILREISKNNRHTMSDTLNILIEKHLKPEYSKIKNLTKKESE